MVFPAPGEPLARRYGPLLALILAGEIIFSLPFHIPRFFRPNLLDVFQLSNTQLGDVFALYGIVALLAYFPGGMLADRFPARTLIACSLTATAMGGFYLYTLPSLAGLYLLYAYWGLTTILLFWAALIKATRDWGGQQTQGLAFGLLDGGRGLVASLFATVALLILKFRMTGAAEGIAGLQGVILFYSVMCVLAALLIWRVLPANHVRSRSAPEAGQPGWRQVYRERSVWLQAGVVVCAYCGYKSLDNYGVYAVQVLDLDQIQAASLTTYGSFARPVAAIAAGLWVDRWRASSVVTVIFCCAGLAFLSLSREDASSMAMLLLMANILLTFFAVYALRGVYFSLIEEAKVDRRITGAAVGIISALGFTPDIFFGAITGRILDANPGAVGFQHYFMLVAVLCALGLLFTLLLSRQMGKRADT